MSIIDHIAIVVGDLDEAEAWYTNHLGGEITHREDTYYRLKLENTNIALIKDEKYHPHIGILAEIEEFPENSRRVVHRDGTVGAYVTDPWDNHIEFICYSGNCKEKFLNES